MHDVNDRLFIGIFPGGIVYADRERDEHGDYKRLAFLPYDTLALKLQPDCSTEFRPSIEEHAATIRDRRGQRFDLDACGSCSVVLGDALVPLCHACLGRSHAASAPDFPFCVARAGEACGAADHIDNDTT